MCRVYSFKIISGFQILISENIEQMENLHICVARREIIDLYAQHILSTMCSRHDLHCKDVKKPVAQLCPRRQLYNGWPGSENPPPSVALRHSSVGVVHCCCWWSSTPISSLFQKKIMAAESIDTNCMTLTRYF